MKQGRINPTQPRELSIAPYVSPDMWIVPFKAFWNSFLQQAVIDTLIIQDGFGCHRYIGPGDIAPLYAAIGEEISAHNIHF